MEARGQFAGIRAGPGDGIYVKRLYPMSHIPKPLPGDFPFLKPIKWAA